MPMRFRVPCLALAAVVALIATLSGQRSGTDAIDAAFERFWRARTAEEVRVAADAVAALTMPVGEATARVRRGRPYTAAPRGVVRLSHRTRAGEFAYTLDVPDNYTPAKPHPVRVQLHGGVGRAAGEARGIRGVGALAGAEQIYVLPTAWRDAPWWSEAQLESLRVILDALKRTYNVDENRIVMSGVSDGGTGAFYFAMRDPTAYASFLPLNGFMMILANPSLELREGMYPHHLLNKPFFVVNGARDPLYPTEMVDPYIRHFRRGGAAMTYLPQPDGEHNTAWWPEVKEPFETFVREHPRQPHPASLTWETDAPEASGRLHWLVIDELRPAESGAPLPDLNDWITGSELNFGVRTAGMTVTSVMPGSNAARFGLAAGDRVAAVNGRALPGGLNLLDFLGLFDPGTPLTLEVIRPDKSTKMELAAVYQPTVMNRVSPLFPRTRPSGRVDVTRSGNTVRATTRGVASFRLLLSSDAFDLMEPITVAANGRTVFSGRVRPAVATVMAWAARDNDRTMVYAAELKVLVP